MSSIVLQLDKWDAGCPVLLPLGPVTVAPILYASVGVLVPFILFCLALFLHLWSNMFISNLKDRISAGEGESPFKWRGPREGSYYRSWSSQQRD